MSHKFLKETFIELVAVDSPSGFEEPMIRHFSEALTPYVDEVLETPRGNVVGVQRGTDPKAQGRPCRPHGPGGLHGVQHRREGIHQVQEGGRRL